MSEYPDFEQGYYSRTARGIYEIGHGIIRFLKWITYCDRCYENVKLFNLMASVLSAPNIEMSE